MADATIEIHLEDGEDAYGSKRYRPGEQMSGYAMVEADEEVECRHLYVRLTWRTEGRGTRYEHTEVEQDLYQGTLQARFGRSFEFSLTLPDGPWSYEGHYVSIVWELQVQIDVPWSRDPGASQVILLEPERTAADGTISW